jgi:beta-lactamase class A
MALAEDITSILAPLGGRTALAARLFRLGATPYTRAAHGDDHETAAQPDVEPQIAFSSDEVFPAAGLAKLPVAIEFLRRADLGQFDLAERLDMSDTPHVGGSGVLPLLDPATQLSLGELCTHMLNLSDDTAANVLLDLVGMGEVNESLSRMGLTHTKLARRFMDIEACDGRRDNWTSASDMLILLSLIHQNMAPGARWLRETLSHQQRSFELSEGWAPAALRLAHMDGLLANAAHVAGLLSDPHRTCAYCVLTAEQKDLPAARYAIGRVVRLLCDAWFDGGSSES